MDESVGESLISRVAAWKNKEEFNEVYDQIFGENSTNQTKQLALDRLKIWKIRRLNLTPATILSTISILDVQLKDTNENKFSTDELRSMYSNAFTRFLNYISSIMRSRHLQSMYSTARELGIESFLVDLRHLCAHGQVLPSLEISRRTADYCLNWLREFYWERERNFIIDATVRDVHLKSSVEMENAVRHWFTIYDASIEGHSKGAKSVDDLKNVTQNEQSKLELLEQTAEQIRNNRLTFIANRAINELAQLSHQTERDRGNAYIFFDALLDCSYFIKQSADIYQSKSKDERIKFIGLHQNLFRLFAICDYVNVFFIRFVAICEDDLEEDYIRKAASFWANEIATGFINFKQFKQSYKTKKEKNAKFDVDMAPINTDIMTDDIKKIYKELGVNYHGTLIFADTVRRPWSLTFEREFLMERAMNINQYTVEVVQKCVQLIEPALSSSETKNIERLITIYMDLNPSDFTNTSKSEDDFIMVHTLDDLNPSNSKNSSNSEDDFVIVHTLDDCLKDASVEKMVTESEQNGNIWSEAPDGLNWKSCPLGVMP